MPADDFTSCARNTVGDVVDSWDEIVLQPMVDIANWFSEQDTAVKYIFGGIVGAAGASAVAWLGKLVGIAAAEIALPVLGAFAVGVGIGSSLVVVGECADQL